MCIGTNNAQKKNDLNQKSGSVGMAGSFGVRFE
jgi:hypothetical protein